MFTKREIILYAESQTCDCMQSIQIWKPFQWGLDFIIVRRHTDIPRLFFSEWSYNAPTNCGSSNFGTLLLTNLVAIHDIFVLLFIDEPRKNRSSNGPTLYKHNQTNLKHIEWGLICAFLFTVWFTLQLLFYRMHIWFIACMCCIACGDAPPVAAILASTHYFLNHTHETWP